MNLLLFKLANFVINSHFLGAVVDDPKTLHYDESTGLFSGPLEFLNPIMSALGWILPAILILVSTAGTIYAVVLGINMAKAETADKREEAKKRIINAVLALVITIALILLLGLFKSNLGSWIG